MRTTVLPLLSSPPRLRLLPIRRWLKTARERRQLAALDDRMLSDIGLTRQQALRESARPFWDAPR